MGGVWDQDFQKENPTSRSANSLTGLIVVSVNKLLLATRNSHEQKNLINPQMRGVECF